MVATKCYENIHPRQRSCVDCMSSRTAWHKLRHTRPQITGLVIQTQPRTLTQISRLKQPGQAIKLINIQAAISYVDRVV